MPVNGLLVTLSKDSAVAEAACALMAARDGLSLGTPRERWLPVAVETADVRDSHDLHEWIEALPGVEQVDVIYAGFDETISTP